MQEAQNFEEFENANEDLELTTKDPDLRKALGRLLPVSNQEKSKLKSELVELLNQFYKEHGIDAHIH
mgnify:CR=1 FL=1